jgi:hypothetical protein
MPRMRCVSDNIACMPAVNIVFSLTSAISAAVSPLPRSASAMPSWSRACNAQTDARVSVASAAHSVAADTAALASPAAAAL